MKIRTLTAALVLLTMLTTHAQEQTLATGDYLFRYTLRDSALHGPCIVLSADNVKLAEGNFQNGRMSGVWTYNGSSRAASFTVDFRYDSLGAVRTELRWAGRKNAGRTVTAEELVQLRKKNKDKVFLFSKSLVREIPCSEANYALTCDYTLFSIIQEEIRKNGMRLYRDEQLKEPFIPTADELASMLRTTSIRLHEQITARLKNPVVEQMPVSYGLVMNSKVNEWKVIGWISAINFNELLRSHAKLSAAYRMVCDRTFRSVVVKEANINNKYLAEYTAAVKRTEEGVKAELIAIATALQSLGMALNK